MLPEEETQLCCAFDKARATGTPIVESRFAAVARGLVEKSRPGSTSLSKCPLEFSVAWAKLYLKSHGFSYRATGGQDDQLPGSSDRG